MAGIRDGAIYKAGPWPQGVNNTAEEGELPTNEFGTRPVALREADNVDLTAKGRPSRRAGRTPIYSGSLAHSLWSDDRLGFGLFVDDGSLFAIFPDRTTQALGVVVGAMPLSYALINDRVYFSNRTVSGLLTLDLQAWSWSPEAPGGQPTLTAVDGYALDPGVYQVAVTYTDALGRESGTTQAVLVDVTEGQGIELSSIPTPEDAVATPTVNVYCTGPNDQVLKLYASLFADTQAGVISAAPAGRPCATQFLAPLPAGQLVRAGHGRQWVAVGPELFWSEPLRYGLFNPVRNRIRFHADIDLLEPVGDGAQGAGVYVAVGTHTYWYGGADPKNFTQAVAARSGAVAGSGQTLPGSDFGLDSPAPIAVWLSDDGKFVVGAPGGQMVTMANGAVIDDADRAAVLYREQNGVMQLIAALRGPQRQGLAVVDRAYAHVVHEDA